MKKYAASNWFEQLFGFTETDRRTVHSMLEVDGATFRSRQNELQWTCGKLELFSLAELRCRRDEIGGDEISGSKPSRIRVSELIGDVKLFHADPANAGALFQVASQFSLLEMVGPDVTPERPKLDAGDKNIVVFAQLLGRCGVSILGFCSCFL